MNYSAYKAELSAVVLRKAPLLTSTLVEKSDDEISPSIHEEVGKDSPRPRTAVAPLCPPVSEQRFTKKQQRAADRRRAEASESPKRRKARAPLQDDRFAVQ
jgi:hypothetical protein